MGKYVHSASSTVVKILLVLTFVLISVIGYVAVHMQQSQRMALQPTLIPQPTSAPTPSSVPSMSPIPTVSTAPMKVSGGENMGTLYAYSFILDPNWIQTRSIDTTKHTNTLLLSNGTYKLSISQSLGGVSACIFPGEEPQPMSQVFTSGSGINGVSSQFMRGASSDTSTYTVCESKGTQGYSIPTQFGYITYTVPSQPDAKVIAQMDGMVASLTKQSTH